MFEIMIPSLFAGLGVAVVAGPMGCFLVWRRMAFFGDTLAHAVILGVALAVLLDWNFMGGVGAVSFVVALILVRFHYKRSLTFDTLLNILSQGTLALGILILAFLDPSQINLYGVLFGDILAVDYSDLLWICFGGGGLLLILMGVWRQLLNMTVHEEYAAVEGVHVRSIQFIFMMLIALFVTLSLKIIGALLVTALLIIPATTARYYTKTPESMAFVSSFIGACAVLLGVLISMQFDFSTGPVIVIVALSFFLLTHCGENLKRWLPGTDSHH